MWYDKEERPENEYNEGNKPPKEECEDGKTVTVKVN